MYRPAWIALLAVWPFLNVSSFDDIHLQLDSVETPFFIAEKVVVIAKVHDTQHFYLHLSAHIDISKYTAHPVGVTLQCQDVVFTDYKMNYPAAS